MNEAIIPHDVEYLPNLRVLDLRANKIAQLDGLRCSESLESLSLSCNCLRTLSLASDVSLPNLKAIFIFGNYLSSLADVLGFLERCASLEVSVLRRHYLPTGDCLLRKSVSSRASLIVCPEGTR